MKKVQYNRIKAVLAETGISNGKLAKHLGIRVETVSRWCTNDAQPSLKRLFEIAEYVKVDVRLLLVSTEK